MCRSHKLTRSTIAIAMVMQKQMIFSFVYIVRIEGQEYIQNENMLQTNTQPFFSIIPKWSTIDRQTEIQAIIGLVSQADVLDVIRPIFTLAFQDILTTKESFPFHEGKRKRKRTTLQREAAVYFQDFFLRFQISKIRAGSQIQRDTFEKVNLWDD